MIDPEELYYKGKLWGTKDHRFWCLLSNLLVQCKPSSILELGSGRSTTFFAEYATMSGIKFVSIEESVDWYAETYRNLQMMFLPGTYVKHVPVDPATAWYNRELIENALDIDAYDLVMIDGPSGRSIRDQRGNEILDMAMRKARMVIVDDTNREDCHTYASYVAEKRLFTKNSTVTYMQRRRGSTTGSVAFDENTATILTTEWSGIVNNCIRNVYGPV